MKHARNTFSTTWVALLCILNLSLSVGFCAESTNASEKSVQTVLLSHKQLSFSPTHAYVQHTLRSNVFAKEPEVARGSQRGTLTFSGYTNRAIPFIWDNSAGKLFLDLNGNGDFVDEGAFTCDKPFSKRYQTFTNVHLSLESGGVKRPFIADVKVYNYGMGNFNCSMECKSMWSAKIALHGREFQIGLVENPGSTAMEGSYMIWRPWEENNEPFTCQDCSAQGFTVRSNLFFQDHAYSISRTFIVQDGVTSCRVELREQQAALGELKLTGSYIENLLLVPKNKESYVVLLHKPGPVVKIPQGVYKQGEMLVKRGKAAASRKAGYEYPGRLPQDLVIKSNTAAVFKWGGPLTNSVAVTRRGKLLSLSYRLVGADGAEYKLQNEDQTKPPQFAVFKNGKKIASGKFAYG